MKNIKSIFAISLLVITPLEVLAQTNQNRVDGEIEDSNVILRSQEIPGLQVHKTMPGEWITSFDQSGKPPGQPGVLQQLEVQQVKARMHLAEFNTENEARLAAAHYITNMASVFSPGIWQNATNQSIGDESWYGHDTGNTTILMRTGITLALVSCHTGTREQQEGVAIMLAVRIAAKIRAGKRVIVPLAR